MTRARLLRYGSLVMPMFLAASSLGGAADAPAGRSYRILVISTSKPSFDRFVNLMNAIGAQAPGTAFTFEAMAEAAAIPQLVAGTADMVVPYPKAPMDGKPYFLSAAPVTKAYYVLYTNTARPLDLTKIAQYTIEGDRRNEGVLGLSLRQSTGPEDSLTKVHDGTIDAYINAEGATDPALRTLGFKNIHRYLYKETQNYVLLSKTGSGPAIDGLLSQAVPRAAGTPGYDDMQKRPYGDWQP
jgi:polar amino acid transport system substrate-binding protein